jgi:uncharacterized protein (TIGR02118 family)
MVKLFALVKRKPGMSLEAFIDYYENKHVPLIMELLPYAIDYRRNYLMPGGRYENPFADVAAPVADFDVVTEVWYPDRAAFDRMQSESARPEIGDRIAADEENFVDRARIIMFVAEERGGPV